VRRSLRGISSRERAILGGILAVALVLRVVWCFYAARLPSGSLHDPNFYYLYGQQLANGRGYRLLKPAVAGCVGPHCLGEPTAYYPPGYAFSLAPFIVARLPHAAQPLPERGGRHRGVAQHSSGSC